MLAENKNWQRPCANWQCQLTDKEMVAVESVFRGIVNNLLHGPMAHLRNSETIEGKQQL